MYQIRRSVIIQKHILDLCFEYFDDNKYRKWYIEIITRILSSNRKKLKRDSESYVFYERHHIIPKSISPEFTKDKDNLVLVTTKEHFILHRMLVKMTSKNYRRKMFAALSSFTMLTSNRILPSRCMSVCLEARSQVRLGVRHTKESKEKMSRSKAGVPNLKRRGSKNPVARERMLSNQNPMKFLRHNRGTFKKGHIPNITPERNEKIRLSKLGPNNHNYGRPEAANNFPKESYRCPHCDIETTKGNFVRWHGPKCKKVPVYPNHMS